MKTELEKSNNLVLPILVYPDERLHQISKEVTEFDEGLENLGKWLLSTMKAKSGIGLSAPQIGVFDRVIAVWIDEKLPMVFVNPEILKYADEKFAFKEGCLSVPGYFEIRERSKAISLRFKDIKGNIHTSEFDNLYAFCIQHEIDHLNGHVFVDDLSELKRQRIKTKLKKHGKAG